MSLKWNDKIRLYMINKSEHYYGSEKIYQFGFYDGYNKALKDTKANEMLEMLNKALIIINDLDAANSDMMNELYQTKVYKNFTKHLVFCDKLEQLIKEATEL